MAAPRVGWVRIASSDPPLSVTARLAEERPNVEDGYGGWDEVVRPRRSPITTWRASPGLKLTLPILLDGWAEGRSVEREVAQLEQMGRPTASDGDPPRVRLEATGNAIPYLSRVWVITALAFGDALMNRAGNRVRQQVTLSLLEYVHDVYLAQRSAANRRRRKAAQPKTRAGARSKRVVVKRSGKPKPKTKGRTAVGDWGAGESLASIAAHELGDAARWIEIAQLNGIRDPTAVEPGQVLRLP
jgi:LysM domain